MKRLILLLVSLLVIGGLAAGGYALTREDADERMQKQYRFEAVTRGPLVQSVAANGSLNPVTLVSVGTQVSGTVKKLYVDFNDKVQKDQVLLELDDSILSASVRQSQASVSNAQASLALAQANVERMRGLYAKEYVSKQELDQAEQVLRSSQAQVDLARAQLDRDKANLANTVIRSPVDGVVVNRAVDVGQTVAASFQTPTLIQIAQDLSKMQINSSFAEADIGHIKEGQPVRFKVDAFPERDFEGRVRQIRLNATNVQNVVTYDVVVEVDNSDLTLLPGMTAYVNVIVTQIADALLIPNNALRFRPRDDEQKVRPGGDKAVVYALRAGKLEAVAIEPGAYDGQRTQVLKGELREGEMLATGERNPGEQGRGPGGGGRRFRF